MEIDTMKLLQLKIIISFRFDPQGVPTPAPSPI